MDKAMEYLCLGRKAGLVTTGETGCGSASAAGRIRLLLLASDASDNARRRAESFLRGRRAPLARVPWTKEELSECMGKAGCAMLCFTDLGLASPLCGGHGGNRPGLAGDGGASGRPGGEGPAAESRPAKARSSRKRRKEVWQLISNIGFTR